jgi:hypothetical protein
MKSDSKINNFTNLLLFFLMADILIVVDIRII